LGEVHVPRKVLVVDDSPTIRAFARIYLKALGVDVEEAEDGEKALAMVRAGPPDVCVVDVDMPNLDGLGFTRDLRKEPNFAFLPIILLTGDRSPKAKEDGLAAGADEVVQKPIQGPALQSVVRKYLEPAA
jgi:two-component system chemotaxis response regulator CheY